MALPTLTLVSMMLWFGTEGGVSTGASAVWSARPRVSNQAGSADAPSSTVLTADLLFCVNETNRYRAMAGKSPLNRSTRLEEFAAEGARRDGSARVAHAHFNATRNQRIAFAENEVPWWPFARSGNVQSVIRQGIAGFWAEGTGGGHYKNLTGMYTQVGCGVFVNNGEITIVQDFR